ncbi:2-succinyl-5-enolpyruvyl-6-hydroxy-3-cyclohexene-1-carboxylic-acid synthase [Sciscionella marina]|uniref:2-succinyl-5-enolpyruvyl-6-hydroxy-3- cyclohexene-1-carboxylic-acid synthase n=1 Tax=Sciscionella marina TaxID=508770 RepID=UPI00035ED87E|nr:2-succinyl-5-enolpyruvyl-6-hydroxy-3-cyclohexene-1-carboxylic-acid synthase [Sciscionella marina]
MSLNPSTAQARVIVDELIRCGIGDVVLCPGSRNAPLSFALHDAERAGRIRLHVRIDERSAGFLALGLSRGFGHGPVRTGRVALTCTSGTALANLHPAVLEAAHSREPLVLLTADRPAELVGSGANQTTQQHGLFAPHVRTVDFPLAEHKSGQNKVWRGILCRTLAGATGPLHLNIPFREPLVPEEGDWPGSLEGRAEGVPWTAITTRGAPDSGGTELLRALPSKTLVIVGDAPWHAASAAGEVARRMDWPLLVEPPGVGPRYAISSASLILNSVDELPAKLQPEAIVLVGRSTLSRGVNRLLGSGLPVHLVCTPEQWADAQYLAESATEHLDPSAIAELTEAEVDVRAGGQWSAQWRKENSRVTEVIKSWLANCTWPSGAHVALDLLAALPSPATMFLGSSNAIRDVDLVAERRGDLTVLANRGLAGIDGNVSTAIGASLAVAAKRGRAVPGYAFLGDLTFLHDVNGLQRAPGEPEPDLTIVVNNDDGGGIFGLLEQGQPEYAESFERVFGTAHRADIGALCAGYGVRHTIAQDRATFAEAVRPAPGLRVIEVRTDRERLRAERARLRASVAAALCE